MIFLLKLYDLLSSKMNPLAPPRLRRFTNDFNAEHLIQVRRNLMADFEEVAYEPQLNLEWEDMISEEIDSGIDEPTSDIDEDMEIDYESDFEESITEIRPWQDDDE
jgi:hypothetical protein